MSSEAGSTADPILPISISQVGSDYLIFSPAQASYLRRTHHITGVLSGTIPQTPQQNVFLGLPLRLLPEEARLLLEKGVAHLVDERKAHTLGLEALKEVDKIAWLKGLDREIQGIGKMKEAKKKERTDRWRSKSKISTSDSPEPGMPAERTSGFFEETADEPPSSPQRVPSPTPSATPSDVSSITPYAVSITPHTSYPPLRYPTAPTAPQNLPQVPSSYSLYAHLHALNYFLSPGLRFGCTYLTYPGDPLRFHSHFLTISKDWDEEFDVMEIVGGGRLGTNVKKGFLIGGEMMDAENGEQEKSNNRTAIRGVRCFSVEWAGM